MYNKKPSFVTMMHGNPEAFKRTIESVKGVVEDIVVGDLMIYESDRQKVLEYGNSINIELKMVTLPFNSLFKQGFSAVLNLLNQYTRQDLCLYLNVSEILITSPDDIWDKISPSYNCYYIDHPTEVHKWYRLWNKKEVQWGGIIHEEIWSSNLRPCSVPLFTFDDTPKDQEGTFYWETMNSIKECVYWNLYLKLVDQPHLVGNTNQGWVNFVRDIKWIVTSIFH